MDPRPCSQYYKNALVFPSIIYYESVSKVVGHDPAHQSSKRSLSVTTFHETMESDVSLVYALQQSVCFCVFYIIHSFIHAHYDMGAGGLTISLPSTDCATVRSFKSNSKLWKCKEFTV